MAIFVQDPVREASKLDYKKSIEDHTREYIINNFIMPEYLRMVGGRKITSGDDFLTKQQKDLLFKTTLQREILVSKGRQCGATALMICQMAADIILSEGNDIILYAGHNTSSAIDIFSRVTKLVSLVSKKLWTFEFGYFFDERKNNIVDTPQSTPESIRYINGVRLIHIPKEKYEVLCRRFKDILNVESGTKITIYGDEVLLRDDKAKDLFDWIDSEVKKRCYNHIKRIEIMTCPNNRIPYSFNIIKEYDEKGQRSHLYPINEEDVRKKIANQGFYTDMVDEILGIVKKIEVLNEKEAMNWIKIK